MRLAFVSLFQAAALVAALPQQSPSPVPDTPLPPGAVPDSPATGPPVAPPTGTTAGTGPGGSNMVADSITMVGTGCPVGAGGLVQEVREGTPVFTFTEWNLALADASPATEGTVVSVEKFCQEVWKLSSGPTGMQFRIGTVTIEGWADLKIGSKIDIAVETRLGDAAAGNGTATVNPPNLKDGALKVAFDMVPEIWSSCVGKDGIVPTIFIKTTITLHGNKGDASVLGSSNKEDRPKVLKHHFLPIWRNCA